MTSFQQTVPPDDNPASDGAGAENAGDTKPAVRPKETDADDERRPRGQYGPTADYGDGSPQ